MKIRSLDSSGDWTFGKGLNDYASDEAGIVLNIKTRLKQWREDCFYAVAEGVDYNNLMDFNTKVLLDQDVLRIATQSDGVLRILSYESTIEDERTYTGTMVLDTVYSSNVTLEV